MKGVKGFLCIDVSWEGQCELGKTLKKFSTSPSFIYIL